VSAPASFGIVLWEIITGDAPQRGHMRPPVVPDECPAEAADLMQRCLDDDPRRRPTAQEVCDRQMDGWTDRETDFMQRCLDGDPQGRQAEVHRQTDDKGTPWAGESRGYDFSAVLSFNSVLRCRLVFRSSLQLLRM
jgi:serine/threonine protein kinase